MDLWQLPVECTNQISKSNIKRRTKDVGSSHVYPWTPDCDEGSIPGAIISYRGSDP